MAGEASVAPTSAAILHLQRPALPRGHGPQLSATSPRTDLVAHGFLVLLVGGFHLGSGRADVDL